MKSLLRMHFNRVLRRLHNLLLRWEKKRLNCCFKKSVKDLLRSSHPPRGLIAGNDLTLLEILKLCKEENVLIPDELAIIGIDEVPFANAFQPSITTIAQPTFKMGKKAAELLFEK